MPKAMVRFFVNQAKAGFFVDRAGGDAPIENLTVLFPEDEIDFGDVLAGATTGYQPVPNGVYQYAAYRFEVDGEAVTQPFLDWVGEAPIPGDAFTYAIDFDPSRPAVQIVQLIEVTQDE